VKIRGEVNKMKRLSESILEELKKAGFVHVTDLEYIYEGIKYRIRPPQNQDRWGTYGMNNLVYCLVTEDGQVWIGPYLPDNFMTLVANLCPKGRGKGGGWAPEAQWINTYLINRLVDPYLGLKDVEPANEPEETFEDVLDQEVFGAPLEEVALDPRDDKGERLVYQKGIRNP